jgi:multiple sugar transport system permease protein
MTPGTARPAMTPGTARDRARPAPQRRGPSLARRRARAGLLFVLPQVFGLLVFTAGPLVASLGLSFTNWDLVAPAPTFTGLENWRHLLGDDRIPAVLLNTVRFILVGTTTFLIFSLLAALLTFTPRRGVGFYRAALFLPYVLSQIAVGVVWRWMFNSQSGPVTLLVELFAGSSPDWLLDPRTAMPSIAIVVTWQTVGYGMTLYIAALQGVPAPLIEAATIDGANRWQRFRYVTVPLISPTVLFLTVTYLIGAFQLFDPVVAMTGASVGGSGPATAGGPSDSTRTIVLYMYNQMFNYNDSISGLGYAAAIAWLLAMLIFLVTAAQFFVGGRFVYYEGDRSPRRGRRGRGAV